MMFTCIGKWLFCCLIRIFPHATYSVRFIDNTMWHVVFSRGLGKFKWSWILVDEMREVNSGFSQFGEILNFVLACTWTPQVICQEHHANTRKPILTLEPAFDSYCQPQETDSSDFWKFNDFWWFYTLMDCSIRYYHGCYTDLIVNLTSLTFC